MDWNDLLADAAAFIAMVGAAGAGEVVPLGHSVGGSIVLSGVIRGRLKPHRFVVSSPALRVRAKVPAWKLKLGDVAARGLPKLALDTELNVDHLTRDPAVNAAYRNDPLTHSKMSARFYSEWQSANREILARAGEIQVPFLVTHGTDDQIIDPAATEEFFARSTAPGKTMKLYAGSYHEPYNDIDQGRVFADLATWLGVQ